MDKPSEEPDDRIKSFLARMVSEAQSKKTSDAALNSQVSDPSPAPKPVLIQDHEPEARIDYNDEPLIKESEVGTSSKDMPKYFRWILVMFFLFVFSFLAFLFVFKAGNKRVSLPVREEIMYMKREVPSVGAELQQVPIVEPISHSSEKAPLPAEAIKKSEQIPSSVKGPCNFPMDPNGGSWLIPKGACFALDNSKGEIKNQPFAIISDTAIISVSGGDFIVFTADSERLSCYSGQSQDNCTEWMREHVSVDADGKRVFLFMFAEGEQISISTANE